MKHRFYPFKLRLKIESFCLLGMLLAISISVHGQAEVPLVVVDIQGAKKIEYSDAKGENSKISNGALLNENCTLILKEREEVILLQGTQFKSLNTPGKHLISPHSGSGGMSLRSFEPIFADYLKSSYSLILDNINLSNIKVKNRNDRGDAWNEDKSISGWGPKDSKNNGGWGAKDSKNNGGWGPKDSKNNGGWGAKDSKNNGGWGAKDSKNNGGWGVSNQDKKEDWGLKHPLLVSGWGAKDSKNNGGWGPKDSKNNGGWGPKDSKNNGGWGNASSGEELILDEAQMTLIPISPGGLYSPHAHHIAWLGDKQYGRYMFSIFDENVNPVFTTIVQKAEVDFDFGTLISNGVYYWQVFSEDKNAFSPPVSFKVTDVTNIQSIRDHYEKSKIYGEGSNSLKGMMKAVAFEENLLYLDANETYERLLSKDKNNDVLRIMFSAYCIRMGQTARVEKIISKI
ncbi:MAG: hypothetical protein KDC16_00115 [Saprospiraceae bacterium]|nr:hypothetical protein [Saprospiraceae bacterium]